MADFLLLMGKVVILGFSLGVGFRMAWGCVATSEDLIGMAVDKVKGGKSNG